MKHKYAACLFFFALAGLAWNAQAFTWFRPQTSTSTSYPSYTDNSYDHSYSGSNSFSSGSGYLASLAHAASSGAGHLSKKGSLCYRSVKQIVAAALGKDLGCIRGLLSSVAAKNAGRDLERIGFHNDSSQCKTQGAIRVYKGVPFKGARRLAGDIYGHVEVVGDDNNYHSFYSSSMSMDDSMPGRRILTGCYVPDDAKVKSGPAGRCPAAHSSGTHKTRRSGGR